MPKLTHIIQGFCLLALCSAFFLFAAACSDTVRPPYIKAQVVDVYNNKTEIFNAHFCYWWQERGETAFLDTYSEMSRELLIKRVEQNPQSAGGNSIPLRIHLQDLKKIEWELTGSGKKMLVYRTQGPAVEAQCLFPQDLRVDPEAGLADYTCFIVGASTRKSRNFDFRQDLNFLKSITVTGVDEEM